MCNQETEDDMIEFENQFTKFGDLNYFRHKTPLKNYPKIPDFLNPHTLSTTYFFPIYKCNDARCLYHELLREQKIEKFGEPVPVIDENNEEHYMQGNDPEQKHLPSRLLYGLL